LRIAIIWVSRDILGAHQLSGGVERRARTGDGQLLGDYGNHHHLQQFAQLMEPAFAASRARRGAQDGRHLAAEDLQGPVTRLGPRNPVEGVFQQGGEAAVVLRRRDGEAVALACQVL
jgi:hypothetical protein